MAKRIKYLGTLGYCPAKINCCTYVLPAGDFVELPDNEIKRLLRDYGAKHFEVEGSTRDVEQPPNDRMRREPTKRRAKK